MIRRGTKVQVTIEGIECIGKVISNIDVESCVMVASRVDTDPDSPRLVFYFSIEELTEVKDNE